MSIETIIEKINKLLALAEKNPEQNEAISAAAKAQELIAKYNIEIEKLGKSTEEEITISKYSNGKGYKWRYQLGSVVAKNFRCKCYALGRDDIVFYGYKRDTEAALAVFKFLFKTGNKLADKEYNRIYNSSPWAYTKGIRNSFLVGFVSGVKSVLDEQCKALMIVTPTEVEEAYAEHSKNFGTVNSTLNTRGGTAESYERGHRAGREAMQSRQMASGVEQLPA